MARPALTDPFRIGDVEVANRVLLAPLAGSGNLWYDAVARSRRDVAEAVAAGGLDRRAAWAGQGSEEAPSLRWILVHLIEEYARHNGHADLLREAVDGQTGE